MGQVAGRTVFSVIDYKTGKTTSLKEEHIASGERLQLPIYVAAAQALLFKNEATPIAAGYWTMDRGFDKRGALNMVQELADEEAELEPEQLASVRDELILPSLNWIPFCFMGSSEHLRQMFLLMPFVARARAEDFYFAKADLTPLWRPWDPEDSLQLLRSYRDRYYGGAAKPAISFFERYLTVWVALCIVVGVALGQFFPGLFKTVASLEVAQVNIPVGLLIWVMIIPMLLKIDFAALGQVKAHARGIGVTLFITSVNAVTLPRMMWMGLRDNIDPAIAAISVVLIAIVIAVIVGKTIVASLAAKKT